jgi:uncharacterized membrane protein YagU involved in acid resistance
MNRLAERMMAGAVAGFVATAPMSAVMWIWHRRLPWNQQDPLPPKQITVNALDAANLDDDLSPAQIAALAALNHFGYGAATGSIYGGLTSARRPASPLLSGIEYGLFVWGISYLGLMPSLGLYRAAIREPADRNWLMLTAHIIWGGSLGLFTEISRQPARSVDVT